MWRVSKGRGSDGTSSARRMARAASSQETVVGCMPAQALVSMPASTGCGEATSGLTKVEKRSVGASRINAAAL
jgi:hypothetical protein